MPLGLGLMRRRRMAGGAAVAGILDAYPGAAFAFTPDVLIYSAHSVTDNAVGSQTEGDTGQFTVRVRRSSDNAVRSFTYAEVGDGTLLTWVGAGEDGFVQCAYDQGTGGNHAVQAVAANQPKIVDAGVLVVENGKVALRFDGSNDFLVSPNVEKQNPQWSAYVVSSYTSNFVGTMLNHDTGVGTRLARYLYVVNDPQSRCLGVSGASNSIDANPFTLAPNVSFVYESYCYGSSIEVFANGNSNGATNLAGVQNTAIADLSIGRLTTTSPQIWSGNIQIVLLYDSDESEAPTPIRTILNNTYNIY